MYTHIYQYIHMYVYVCVHTYTYTYIYTYIRKYIYIHSIRSASEYGKPTEPHTQMSVSKRNLGHGQIVFQYKSPVFYEAHYRCSESAMHT